MITRGAPTDAPPSPSPRATPPPSDSEAQAASPDIVDVTDGGEPWTATSARRVSDPPPIRASKRAPSKPPSDAALLEARKGKKKMAKRTSPASTAATTSKAAARLTVRGSDSDSEEKVPPRATKKAKKAPTRSAIDTPSASRDQGFDLTEFMASFKPGTPSGPVPNAVAAVAGTQPPMVTEIPTIPADLHALKEEVLRLRGLVGAQASTGGLSPLVTTTTAPNAKGELPPSEVSHITSSSFPESGKKTKGDYNPPQAHMLAASRMFRSFGTAAGKSLSAMSFVLWMRELDCVKFQVTLAVLMAIFSGGLGSRGLTLMHFKESSEMDSLEEGSSNANFSSDFSPSASLPSASTCCSTYEDILDAIHGLNTLGQEVWYDHMRKMTSRFRSFVAKNKSADPGNTPARIRPTLLYANKFIGTALGHMQSDDVNWWSGFCEALRAIEYGSAQWTMALISVLNQAGDGVKDQRQAYGRRDQESRREKPRRPAIPDEIRRLVPLNRQGKEPCLLNIAGLPCSGGSRDRCGNHRRIHNWREPLPNRLQEWVDRTYGSRAKNQDDRH